MAVLIWLWGAGGEVARGQRGAGTDQVLQSQVRQAGQRAGRRAEGSVVHGAHVIG